RIPSTFVALAAVLVLVPAVAGAATPSLGVPTPIRRGFFTETDLGIFFTTGGQGANPSNAQAYLNLGVGYDLLSSSRHLLAVGLSFSMGASAGACFGELGERRVPPGEESREAGDGPVCIDPSVNPTQE